MGGLNPGLVFMMRTIMQNSSCDVYKKTVLQTLTTIKDRK